MHGLNKYTFQLCTLILMKDEEGVGGMGRGRADRYVCSRVGGDGYVHSLALPAIPLRIWENDCWTDSNPVIVAGRCLWPSATQRGHGSEWSSTLFV